MDLGIKGKLPIDADWWNKLDPVFAITLQDVGHPRFTGGVGRQKESLSAGFALRPKFWKFDSNFVFDVRDLEYASDFVNKLHVGYELIWPDVSKAIKSISARVGLNQGYFTAGLGMDFRYFKFNLATWGREVSARKMYQKQSRMFGLQLAAGF